jgi:hypothetical protein
MKPEDETSGTAKGISVEEAKALINKVPPPPMREVLKGWWFNRERLVPRSELEEQDRRAVERTTRS